jgi:hypothetical protein
MQGGLAHDPEKWEPVFEKDHAQGMPMSPTVRATPRSLAGATILQLVPALGDDPAGHAAVDIALTLLQSGAAPSLPATADRWSANCVPSAANGCRCQTTPSIRCASGAMRGSSQT